ncbi:MAG: hypothetical protein IKQ46_12490 [Bacteroidales bacterium]|nr:hypothetical protein [Bacteroidales bacterium]
MNYFKTNLCLIALMLISMSISAQNTYPEEKRNAEYAITVTYNGQKPGINDFINAILDEPEDEYNGALAETWENYKTNKPLGDYKVTVDAKNGYVSFEQKSDDGYVAKTEFCYWNCSDTKHKVVAQSLQLYQNGKIVETEFTGVNFFIYNNAAKKLYYSTTSDMNIDLEIDGNVYGIAYNLPRVGKDITANVYSKNGKKDVVIKWNGLRFDKQK